jgi:hypothetical protein
MNTDLGKGNPIEMNRIDFIDKASYLGKIILEDFDIGTLLDRRPG